MKTVVSISNLTKIFKDFTAVNRIDLSVLKGEIFGFLGPNGAGKSTTIKMLCGILTPTSGRGTVNGHDIITEQEKIKKTIGYMSQKFSLYDDLTVIENLEFFGNIYNIPGSRLNNQISTILKMAEIEDRKNSLVKTLPGGLKQRLALGSAILHEPPVLFLDEPTSGVDPVMRRNFWDLINGFSNEGKTIFITTHYMDEAEHCDRIALIIAGEIIAVDSPQNLKNQLPYAVYSLSVDNFIEVFDLVQKINAVRESAIFGSDIHILCDSDYPLKRDLKSILLKLGIDTYDLQRVTPSLEDVFVTHARRHSP